VDPARLVITSGPRRHRKHRLPPPAPVAEPAPSPA